MLSATLYAQKQNITYSIDPSAFEDTTPVTITINGNSINEDTWAAGYALYLWSWSYDVNDASQMDSPSNGSWTASNDAARFTYNAITDTYTKIVTPSVYFGRSGIGKIGFLVKAKDGTGNKQSQDILVEVGSFQATLTAPAENSTTIIASGSDFNITATNTNGAASYTLKANGTTINTNEGTSSYSFNQINITGNQSYELSIVQGAVTISKKFSVVVNPNTVSEAMPAGLEDGIN